MSRPDIITYAMVLLATAAAASTSSLKDQPRGPGEQGREGPPSVSVAIRLRDDAVIGDPEIPLEVRFTNVSDHDLGFGAFERLPPWMEADLDVRDANGKRLAEKPAATKLRSFGGSGSSGPLIAIKPGQGWGGQVVLNRLFDLSKPGQYTVRARVRNSTSNTLPITVGADDNTGGGDAPISMILTAPYRIMKSGCHVPLELKVTNTGKRGISLAEWHGQPRGYAAGVIEYDGGIGIENEFSTGVLVSDSHGDPVALTKSGRALSYEADTLDEPVLPNGRFEFLQLRPNETLEQRFMAGALYDLSRPGTYAIQVLRTDQATHRRVRSNPVSVTIVPGNEDATQAAIPPFWFSLNAHFNTVESGHQLTVYINMINMRGTDIVFRPGWQYEHWDVKNDRGKTIPVTKNGQRRLRFFRKAAEMFPSPTISDPKDKIGNTPTQTIIGLDELYDLSRPGLYTIQVGVFDQVSGSLVRSNKLLLTVLKHSGDSSDPNTQDGLEQGPR